MSVLYCNAAWFLSLHRRSFDSRRRLDRLECKVTQYSDDGERGITRILDVIKRVALLLPRLIPTFQDPANVSGNDKETTLVIFALEGE